MELVRTGDGSMSLRSSSHGILYHSRHGALTESLHVFITHGLAHRAQSTATPPQTLRILEYGIGTGLNALLAYQWSLQANLAIEYVGLEIEPVTNWSQLGYVSREEPTYTFFEEFHRAPWGVLQVHGPATYTKVLQSFLEYEPPSDHFDVIFYDAFAPTAQPELWTTDIWKRCHDALRPRGVWVSYCAKGQVRRDLQSVGFTTSRLPGPPGKREMLRAEKLS